MKKIKHLNFTTLIQAMPPRQQDAHKGHFGHVLVVGGDFGYAGAPVLAGLGALRAGAGLVTIASHRYHLVGLNATHPELMTVAIDEPDNLMKVLPKATVIVLGPGLGRSPWSLNLFNMIMTVQKPMVLDADALFFLKPQMIIHEDSIITPHPGEAARLLDQPVSIPSEQRLQAIKELIKIYSCTTVLKGAGTLVGSPNNDINICTHGNPGMASGGMGDLLSGIIAGLLAQGMTSDDAAKLGVCVHAMAGDKAAMDAGMHGLIATDLLIPIRNMLG